MLTILKNHLIENMLFGPLELETYISQSLAALFTGLIQTGTSIYFLMSSRMIVPEQ